MLLDQTLVQLVQVNPQAVSLDKLATVVLVLILESMTTVQLTFHGLRDFEETPMSEQELVNVKSAYEPMVAKPRKIEIQ